MNLLSERLKWALNRKGDRDGCVYRAADLMRATGASRTAVSFWMSDVNGIEGDNARKAAVFLGVDPVWLETGEGEADPVKREIEMSLAMRRQLVNAEELAQLFTLFAQSTEIGRRQILDGYVIDHIRPLCAGGADDPANMQWQALSDAKVKDKLEWKECRRSRMGKHHLRP